MSNRTTRAVSLCAIAVAFGAGIYAWRASEELPRPASLTHESGAEHREQLRVDDLPGDRMDAFAPTPPAELGAAVAATSVTDAAASVALPSVDLPLVEQLPTLQSLAEQGNPEAACRLFVQELTCADYARNKRFSRMIETSLARPDATGDPETERILISGAALGQEQAESVAALCKGFQPDHAAGESDAWLQRALTRMSVRQRVLLAMLDESGRLLRIPRHPPTGSSFVGGSTDYLYPRFLSEHAVQFLRDGIQAADPLALEGMILLHAPARLPGPESIRPWLPDAYRFVGYALLLRELYGQDALGHFVLPEMLDAALGSLSADEKSRLLSLVDAEKKRWLAQQRAAQMLPEKSPTAELCVE